MMSEVAISIFGSCVTRDVFEIDKELAAKFEIKTYIARQTIVSSLSKPLSCDESDIKLDSAFQRRMVLSDLRKDAFKQFRKDKSRFIVIDLIDERLGMLELQGSVVTQSSELINSGYTNGLKTARIRMNFSKGEYMVGSKSLRDYCRKFCNKLRFIYPQKNIIIHRALGVSSYYDETRSVVDFPEDQIKKCETMNKQLNFMYDALEEFLPKASVINTAGRFHGDCAHKWGLSIVHYEPDYYKFVLNELRRITDSVGRA